MKSSAWDYIIALGLGVILFAWRDDIVVFWTRPLIPVEFCIPLRELIRIQFRMPTWEQLGFYAVLTAVEIAAISAFISGQHRVLRALRIGAFAVLVADLLVGVHIPDQTPWWMPRDLEIALWRFTWFIYAAFAIISSLVAISGAAVYKMPLTPRILLAIQGFGFINVAMAGAAVKRWTDVAVIALLGWLFTQLENLSGFPEYQEGKGYVALSGAQILGIQVFFIAIWFAICVIAWHLFLSGWQIRFC